MVWGAGFPEVAMVRQGGCPRSVSWSCCMLARLVLGAVTAGAMVAPALAGMMNADEARKFVAGKVFAFTCFDGTRGAGRVLDDLGDRKSTRLNSSHANISYAVFCL